MSSRKKSSAATAESDAVEQLLQAAQDEVLLNLSVDTHMSRVAPDYLDPNLHRRFQALRSRPSSSQSKSHSQQRKQSSVQPPPPPISQQDQKEDEEKKERKSKVVVADNVDEELKAVLGDDLSARFAALKASLSSNPTAAATSTNEVRNGLEKSDGEDDEEDEVEKVIRWAKDAARLDPSPSSDDDDDHMDSDSDNNDNDSDYDDDPKHKNKETKRRK